MEIDGWKIITQSPLEQQVTICTQDTTTQRCNSATVAMMSTVNPVHQQVVEFLFSKILEQYPNKINLMFYLKSELAKLNEQPNFSEGEAIFKQLIEEQLHKGIAI